MLTRECFVKVVLCSSNDYTLLVSNVKVKNLRKRESFWLIINKCEHIYSAGVLELRVFIKLIKNYLTVSVASVLDNDAHTVSARLVAKVGNTLNSLVLVKSRNSLAELALVYAIGDLGEDNAVLVFLDRTA